MALPFGHSVPLEIAAACEAGNDRITALRRDAVGERLAARSRRRLLARLLRGLAARLEGGDEAHRGASAPSFPPLPEAPA